METALGIVIGILGSILVGRYYYLRSVSKELSVFELFNSPVFAGIAPDVRHELHFRFKEQEVTELQQVMFLVANTGFRAIGDIKEPLSLRIPPSAAILDASIVHRFPEDLGASLRVVQNRRPEGDGMRPDSDVIHFETPILNAKEYFVVKLLLSGNLQNDSLTFQLLCPELPRTIRISSLPPNSYNDTPYKFEWGLAGFAVAVLAIPAWIAYTMSLLHELRPELFPYPLATYVPSLKSLTLVTPAFVLLAVFTLLGLTMLGAAMFRGEFPPRKGPRFPLPKAVRDAVYPFPTLRFHPEFGETPAVVKAPEQPSVTTANVQTPHGQ